MGVQWGLVALKIPLFLAKFLCVSVLRLNEAEWYAVNYWIQIYRKEKLRCSLFANLNAPPVAHSEQRFMAEGSGCDWARGKRTNDIRSRENETLALFKPQYQSQITNASECNGF